MYFRYTDIMSEGNLEKKEIVKGTIKGTYTDKYK